MPRVTLISSDCHSFNVDAGIAKLSFTLRGIMEVCQFEETEESTENLSIPLSNVSSATLAKVIEWCEQQNTAKSEREKQMQTEKSKGDLDTLENWNEPFLELENSVLFDLIIAANYLAINDLLIFCCKTVALMFRGKTADDIRKIFGIMNDLTPEEEAVIDDETAWMSEHKAACPCSTSCTSRSKDVFPLLDLPNEIISMILQQMHPVDRFCGRVCKKLYLLESIGRYQIGEVEIVRGSRNPVDPLNPEKSTLVIGVSDSVEASSYISVFHKIATNCTVNLLIFTETRQASNFEFTDLLHHLKSIRARALVINGDYARTKMDNINDDTLDEWIRGRECLRFPEAYGDGSFALGTEITGVGLHGLFDSMSSSSIPLRRFHVHVHGQAARTMVRRIGITTVAGSFVTTRKDVRVHFSDGVRGACTSRKYFFIVGDSMLITYHLASLYAPGRRHQLQCEPCDLSIERQNGDGSVPAADYFTGAVSIRRIIETFPAAPLVFSM